MNDSSGDKSPAMTLIVTQSSHTPKCSPLCIFITRFILFECGNILELQKTHPRHNSDKNLSIERLCTADILTGLFMVGVRHHHFYALSGSSRL